MALEVRSLRDGARPAAIIADRRLWVAEDRTTVVEDGDPRAAFLLAGQGSEIPATEMARLHLAVDAGRRVVLPGREPAPPVEPAAPTEPTEKSRTAPNKARRKGEDK